MDSPKPKAKAKAKAKAVYKAPPANEQLEVIKKHFPGVVDVKGKYQSKLYTYITEMTQISADPEIWGKPDDPHYAAWQAWMTFEGKSLTMQDAIWIANAAVGSQPELQIMMTSWIAKQAANLSVSELETRLTKENQ